MVRGPKVRMNGILTTPFQHQLDCFNISKDRVAFGIFSDMGTGKSVMCLMTAVYLYNSGKIKRLLIVAPKGCYRSWFDDEVRKHVSADLPYRLAHWSSYTTKEVKKELAELDRPGEALRILVVNVEAFTSTKVQELVKIFMDRQSTLMIVDESTSIKNPQAKRTKVILNLGQHAEYRRICSGNPIPNGPLDIYSQTEFLQKNLLGFTSFFAFRNRFCTMIDQRLGTRSFKKVVGYRDTEFLKELMRKFSFIIKKKDCLDLPPKVYQVVDVEMGPLQAQAYSKMLQESYIRLSEGEVTAEMVMTQLIRLHQICCGFLKLDTGEEITFPEENDRMITLLQLLEQAPGKVIVWANHRQNIQQLVWEIGKKFGASSVVHFYGDTTDVERMNAKNLFQDPNSTVKYIVSNPATGKFGNTWTQATTVIYYSNDYNLESRDQSEDRAHRIGQQGMMHVPGQDPCVLYIDIRCPGTVDDRIIKVLKNKKKLTDEIVQSNWRWLLGQL